MLITALWLPPGACAQGWSLPEARSEWGWFALGFSAGVAGHELGHYVVAKSKGYDVRYDGVTVVYPDAVFSNADGLKVSSAGFQAQWILSELVLRDSRGRELRTPPGNFGAGIVCAHLGITLAYLTVLRNHKDGDVSGIAAAARVSNGRVMAALAVPAALDAWRLFGNDVPGWVPAMSLVGKGLGFAWVWTY